MNDSIFGVIPFHSFWCVIDRRWREIMNTLRKALRFASVCAYFLAVAATFVAQTPVPPPQPKRINRAIELLGEGQPIYYTGSHSGTVGTFEQGKQDAQTWADYISYDMEAAPYDIG